MHKHHVCKLQIGEVVGGIYAHSLAVLTDAAHMLSDVLAFVISLCAGTYALRASKASHTFGYHRAEVLGSMVSLKLCSECKGLSNNQVWPEQELIAALDAAMHDSSGACFSLFQPIRLTSISCLTHNIMHAQMSVLIIWVVTGILVYEAVLRIIHPERVDGKLMFILAIIGIAVNLVNLAILGGHHGHSHGGHDHGHGHTHGPKKSTSAGHAHAGHHEHNHASHDHEHVHNTSAEAHGASGHRHVHADHEHHQEHAEHEYHHDHTKQSQGCQAATGHTHAASADNHHGHDHMSLGMRGAVIHVLGDCVQSFGVVIAAIIIWVKPEYHIADPICTFVFAIAVICTTRGMVRDITDIVMERVPRGFDLPGLEEALSKVPGVCSTHDLHVWALKPGVVVLAVHIDITADSSPAAVLRRVTACCTSVGVHHSTVQLTAQGEACPCNIPSVKQVIAAGPHVH